MFSPEDLDFSKRVDHGDQSLWWPNVAHVVEIEGYEFDFEIVSANTHDAIMNAFGKESDGVTDLERS